MHSIEEEHSGRHESDIKVMHIVRHGLDINQIDVGELTD